MSIVRPVAVRPDLLKPTGSSHPSYPTTTPPSRIDTPPTPELTISNAFIGMYEAKAPPPLDLPSRLSLVRSRSGESESQHGSPCVSPSPSTSASSISSSLLPPSLSETDSAATQQRTIYPHSRRHVAPTYVCGVCLPFAIEEEEEPSESSESSYSIESAPKPVGGQQDSIESTSLSTSHDVQEPSGGKGKLMKRRSLKTLMKRALGGRSLGFKEMLKV